MNRGACLVRELAPPIVGHRRPSSLVWAVRGGRITSSPSLPSPASVWRRAASRASPTGRSLEATVLTLVRLAFSFAVAVVVGTLLGVALALSEFPRRAVRPLVVALQITPFVAWVPLAVIWFGVTERAVVFVAIVGAFPSMTLATIQAIRQVPPLYRRAGQTLGAEGWDALPARGLPGGAPRRDGAASSKRGASRGRR